MRGKDEDSEDQIKSKPSPYSREEVKKEGLRSSSARRLKPSASGKNLRERSGSRGRPTGMPMAKPPRASPMKAGFDPYSEMSKNELIQIIESQKKEIGHL